MAKDHKFFNCSEKHEVEYLANKFQEPKEEVIKAIKELCKEGKIKYSTHQEAEAAVISKGFTKK